MVQGIKNEVKEILKNCVDKSKFLQNHLSVITKGRIKAKLTNDEYREYTLHYLYPKIYDEFAKEPVDEKKVVFVEVRFPTLTNSMQVIYDTLGQNYDYDLHCHFLRDPFAPKEEIERRCIKMLKDVATAKYIFVDEASGVLSCVKMRPETIYTQLWHGCGAFKKFGFSTAELIFGLSREKLLEFPNYKNIDHVTVSSPEVVWAYEEAMGLEPGIVKPIGSSRTDVFYDSAFIDAAFEKLHRLMPESVGKKVILYAPTFRGRIAKAQIPNMLDVPMFHEAFSDEYVLLFKHHPMVKKPPLIPNVYNKFARDFTDVMSIDELLCVSDICISDYSSLVFEFSLFERPLIFYAFDIDEYNDWRGFYYNYDELTPGPVFTTNLEMIDYIKNIETRFDKQRVHEFREKFMSSCDGHATERIMNLVFGEEMKNHLRPESERDNIQYHRMPNANDDKAPLEYRLSYWKKTKKEINKLYKDACSKPIENGKVMYIGYNAPSTAMKRILKKLKKDDAYSVKKFVGEFDEKEAVAEMATAQFVLLDDAVPFTGFVDLRKGTEIIQIWKSMMPIERFGYSAFSALDPSEKKVNEVVTPHKNYTFIPVAGDYTKDCYAEAFGAKPEIFKKIGSVHTDILFDEKAKAKIREKIENVFPNAKGKKIIFYNPRVRLSKFKKPYEAAFLDVKVMHEYLKDEYVMLYLYPPHKKAKLSVSKYFGSFAVDLERYPVKGEGEEWEEAKDSYIPPTAEELMAVADVVIGDYEGNTLNFLATGKPIFFYSPDVATIYSVERGFADYYELTKGFMYYDTTAIAKQIRNLESYDFARLEELRNMYCGSCDGKAVKRLVDYMNEKSKDSKKEALTY